MVEKQMIAALFVETDGVYFGLPDVDPWDERRDARTYAGPWPVVAHPPCDRWCQMAPVNQARYGHKVGEDDGKFAAALNAVRTWGGVLEHPAFSLAWSVFDLPRPLDGGWQRGFCGGWSAQVEQGHYGHRARKTTWLYAFGVDPPQLNWGRGPEPTAWISADRPRSLLAEMGIDQLSKREARTTPIEFRDVLLDIARSAAQAKLTMQAKACQTVARSSVAVLPSVLPLGGLGGLRGDPKLIPPRPPLPIGDNT